MEWLMSGETSATITSYTVLATAGQRPGRGSGRLRQDSRARAGQLPAGPSVTFNAATALGVMAQVRGHGSVDVGCLRAPTSAPGAMQFLRRDPAAGLAG